MKTSNLQTLYKKRKAVNDRDSDSENEAEAAASTAGVKGAWSRFLVVHFESVSQRKISPFILEKWFQGVSSSVQSVKRQKDGSFLVDCPTRKVSDLLLSRHGSALSVGSSSFTISVTSHSYLNTSRGVATLIPLPRYELCGVEGWVGITRSYRRSQSVQNG